jgi:hypothetical protein
MSWLEPSFADLAPLQGRYRTHALEEPVSKAERRRAQSRMWYAKNRERLRAYNRAYYAANRKGKMAKPSREKRRAWDRARYWRNPEKYRAEARARAAKRYAMRTA